MFAILVGILVPQLAGRTQKRGVPISTRRHYAVDDLGSNNSLLLSDTFQLFAMDDALQEFLTSRCSNNGWLFGNYGLVFRLKEFLSGYVLEYCLGWSRTDARGFFQLADMHVASESQFKTLLSKAVSDEKKKTVRLLDIGSGTGSETIKLANALSGGAATTDVWCLEQSKPLQWRLNKARSDAGNYFRVLESFLPAAAEQKFDVVSLLNVLDRCDDPTSLLAAAVNSLTPQNGVLVVAAVLPFQGMVCEGVRGYGGGGGRKSYKRRPHNPWIFSPRQNFQQDVAVFVSKLLVEQPGLQLVSWTKLPYVSSGDQKRTYYVLPMALFVFRLARPAKEDRIISAAPTEVQEKEIVVESSSGSVDDEFEEMVDEIPQMCQRPVTTIYSWLSTNATNMEDVSSVLDAGTGRASLCWLVKHKPEFDTIVAVTATSDQSSYGTGGLAPLASHSRIRLELGNWRDEAFLSDGQQQEKFDVVVADYLLGATELYWPNGAEQLFDRLVDRIKPGGYLWLIGLEPYEEILSRSYSDHERLLLDVESLGDAAALLAGQRTYRELSQEWVSERIVHSDMVIFQSRQFPMRVTSNMLYNQLTFADQMASRIKNPTLRTAVEARRQELTKEIRNYSSGNKVFTTRARNYALIAQKKAI